MTLSDFEALGGYVNAGYLDIYHQSVHKRLAAVTVAGDILLTPEGEVFVASLAPAPAPEVVAPKPAAKRVAKAKAVLAEAPEADQGDLGAELSGMLGE